MNSKILEGGATSISKEIDGRHPKIAGIFEVGGTNYTKQINPLHCLLVEESDGKIHQLMSQWMLHKRPQVLEEILMRTLLLC